MFFQRVHVNGRIARILRGMIATALVAASVMSSGEPGDAGSQRGATNEAWVLALVGTAPGASGSSRGTKGTGGWPRVVRGVGNDGAGGVYISGSFFGEVELEDRALTSHGRSDVLFGRIDGTGHILWLDSFGGPGTDISPDIVADSRGRALLTGMISDGARVSGRKIDTAGGSDAFTAQLSAGGDVLWLRTAGGKRADSGNEIATDSDDNVLVAGNTYGPIAAGNSAFTHRGGMDGFLLKYSALGELLWMRQIAGPGDEQLRGIAADSAGYIAVVGEFTATVDIGWESLTAATELRDVLVARYTPLGVPLWSRRFGGPGADYARGVATDRAGNLYVTGVFTGPVNFGDFTLKGDGDREMLFITRLSPAGDVQWAREIRGSGSGHGCELDVNESGYVLLGCDVMGELGVDGLQVRAAGKRDSFVAVFDSDGNARKLIALGASVAAANFDIVGDSSGRFATLTGVFEGTLPTGPGKERSAAGSSSYIARVALDGTVKAPEVALPAAATGQLQERRQRDRATAVRARRGQPGNPDPDYTGAAAGPYRVEQLTATIPAERWQQDMALRIYAPAGPGPYPVIIFCAGSGGGNDTYGLTSNYLASHGYVVIHNSYTRQRGLGNEELTRNRVLDIGLVLDALDGPLLPLEGKLDKDNIAAMGHSSGAYITQLLGGAVVSWNGRRENFRDPRIDAILMYSGQGSGQQGLTRESWRQLDIPMMVMTGSGDRGAFSQDPSWRREPFDLSPGPGKFLLWYDRGHHGSFSGKFARNTANRAIFEHAQKMTLAFFDAYLKHESDALEFVNSARPKSLNSARADYFWK